MRGYIPTSLARYAPLMRDPDQKGARTMAANAWQEHGVIVLFPDDIKSWSDRQFVVNVANKQYGNRKMEQGQ
jgi:hypothetical protein